MEETCRNLTKDSSLIKPEFHYADFH